MSESKHTPMTVRKGSVYCREIVKTALGHTFVIAKLPGCEVEEAEVDSIARLFAASPEIMDCLIDLLEVAEQVEEDMTGPADKCYFSPALLAKCRAAIASAKGA